MKLYEKGLTDNASQSDIDSQKIYRYSGLIQAIEFFSQRFSLENILEHIYRFTDQLIAVDRIALMVREGVCFSPLKSRGFDNTPDIIGTEVDNIVYFHAGILDMSVLSKYFDDEGICSYRPDMAIQLIMDKKLYGLILLKRDEIEFNVDDRLIADALMNLFYISLTNFDTFNHLDVTKRSLDEKVFNLFAINQSTKALLSELDHHRLNELSISVYAELTQSSLTGMFLYDDKSETYRLLQMMDVYNPSHKAVISLYPKSGTDYDSGLSVIDCNQAEQLKVFMNLFFDEFSVFASLKPHYIVCINNGEKLMGFVTLSKKVGGDAYKSSEFELMESIVASTFIAMNNAIYLEEIIHHREVVTRKLENLNRLNSLMRNINTASKVENLIDLTLDTLKVAFGFRYLFFGVAEKARDGISYGIFYDESKKKSVKIDHKSAMASLTKGEEAMYYTREDAACAYSELRISGEICSEEGLIIVPVTADVGGLELMGFIGVGGVREGLLFEEINITTIKAIAAHVGPVLYQLKKADYLEERYVKNYYKLFTEYVEKEIERSIAYKSDMVILHAYTEKVFGRETVEETLIVNPGWEGKHMCFPVDRQNVLFILEEDEAEDLIRQNPLAAINQYRIEADFNTLEELMSLLHT